MAGGFFAGWSIRKLKATVVNDIYPEVLFFSLVATMVACVNEFTHFKGKFIVSDKLLTVLGTVLGLVISFRTSTAYERFSEGRKLWTTIGLTARNFSHTLWNHIPDKRDADNKPTPNAQQDDEGLARRMLQAQIEKKTMINLVQGFTVAVKHLLRGEPGIYYEDLYPLISFLPRYAVSGGHRDDMMPMWRASEAAQFPSHDDDDEKWAPLAETPAVWAAHHAHHDPHGRPGHSRSATAMSYNTRSRGPSRAGSKVFDPEAVLPVLDTERPLRPAQNPPKGKWTDEVPFLRLFTTMFGYARRTADDDYAKRHRSLLGHKKYLADVESNVPLEIGLYLSSYLAWVLSKGMLTPAAASALTTGLATLQDAAVNLQRIRNTPLPFAYQAHLRMSLWLYLLFLPWSIYSAFKWLVIPATAFASFLLLGFLEIGQEIENPFEYDENDLDLDGFCLQIARELAEVCAHPTPDPATYVFSAWNQPFAPADRRGADEILRDDAHAFHHPDEGLRAVKRALLHSWKDVDDLTRKHRAEHPQLA